MMIVPGFSSARVAPNIRLFIAMSVSLALTPLLISQVLPIVTGVTPAHLLFLIAAGNSDRRDNRLYQSRFHCSPSDHGQLCGHVDEPVRHGGCSD